jgi:hypothetical protein
MKVLGRLAMGLGLSCVLFACIGGGGGGPTETTGAGLADCQAYDYDGTPLPVTTVDYGGGCVQTLCDQSEWVQIVENTPDCDGGSQCFYVAYDEQGNWVGQMTCDQANQSS